MAVISDLHAQSNSDGIDSWVHKTDPPDPQSNPLDAILNVVKEQKLVAEVLLCPGDLCQAADWEALPYAWQRLEELADALEAEHLISTAGNHDLDTRRRHEPDAINQGLLDLAPPFPTREASQCLQYWDERITLVENDRWRVLALNSSLMERFSRNRIEKKRKVKDQGIIDDETLERIRGALSEDTHDVNVLICHHHPERNTRLKSLDRSEIKNGDRLVQLLNDLPSNWFVVHGHEHLPNLDYLRGSGGAATRLAAGSVGANLLPTYAGRVRNQFHIVDFPVSDFRRVGLDLAGHVRSWTWLPEQPWRIALSKDDGLPAHASFGCHRNGVNLADSFMAWARSESLGYVDRGQLLAWDSQLEFLHHDDLEDFMDTLEGTHGCGITLARSGALARVTLPLES